MTLDELKKLCDEATPGPWVLKEHGVVSASFPNSCGENYFVAGEVDEQDAAFIAAARAALPMLIAVAEAVREYQYDVHDAVAEALAALESL